jgi:hypothetical protein
MIPGLTIDVVGVLYGDSTKQYQLNILSCNHDNYLQKIYLKVEFPSINLGNKEAKPERPLLDWIECAKVLPPLDTPVVIVLAGEARIGELRTEHPSYEETFEPYNYWDDPYNDGQDWEFNAVTHWKPLPKLPVP